MAAHAGTVAADVAHPPDEEQRPLREGARRLASSAVGQAFVRFDKDGMTHHAAALAYYAMLSLLPGLLLGVSLLGVIGDASLASRAATYVAEHGADSTTARAVRHVLDSVVTNASSGTASVTLVVSLAIALNGASGAFSAAGRALNVVHMVAEDRSFVHRKIADLTATASVIVLFAIALVAVFLGGGIADDLFGTIGLGDTAASIWSIARWPVALLAMLAAYDIVYAYSPDVEERQFRIVTPGALAGVGFWITASIGFGVYVRHFPNYGAAYGTAGLAILLLLWLWLSANALLYGAELNTELERRRRAPTGPPFPLPPPTAERPIPTLTDAPRQARQAP
jgi:membrane protein